ncbi:MAG: AI-2E family transporter [Anaerolineae bacterium]
MRVRDLRPTDNNVIRWLLIAFAIVITGLSVWLIRDVLLLTLTAIIFALLLTTPIRFFVRHGARRSLAVAITLLLIGVSFVIVTALILPGLLGQFQILITQTLPRAGQLLQAELDPVKLAERYPFLEGALSGINLADLTNQISQQLVAGLANVSGQVFPFLGNLVSTLFSIMIVVFLSIYFVADPDTHWRGMLKLVPLSYRPRARQILLSLDHTLRQFLQAQIVLMVLTGVLTTIAFIALELPLSGVLGVITGFFSFVPNFGPLIALVPILAVVIINSPDKVWLMLAIFFGIQLIVSQVVAPLLLGQEVKLPPALILLSQIIFSVLFGFLGLLLSVPLAAIGIVLVREIYVRDILGDPEGIRATQEIERLEEELRT